MPEIFIPVEEIAAPFEAGAEIPEVFENIGPEAPLENAEPESNELTPETPEDAAESSDRESGISSNLQFVMEQRGGSASDWEMTYSGGGEGGHRFDGKELIDAQGRSLTKEIENAALTDGQITAAEKVAAHHAMLEHWKQNPGEAHLLPDWVEKRDGEEIIHVTVARLDANGFVSYETWSHRETPRKEEPREEAADGEDLETGEHLRAGAEFGETADAPAIVISLAEAWRSAAGAEAGEGAETETSNESGKGTAEAAARKETNLRESGTPMQVRPEGRAKIKESPAQSEKSIPDEPTAPENQAETGDGEKSPAAAESADESPHRAGKPENDPAENVAEAALQKPADTAGAEKQKADSAELTVDFAGVPAAYHQADAPEAAASGRTIESPESAAAITAAAETAETPATTPDFEAPAAEGKAASAGEADRGEELKADDDVSEKIKPAETNAVSEHRAQNESVRENTAAEPEEPFAGAKQERGAGKSSETAIGGRESAGASAHPEKTDAEVPANERREPVRGNAVTLMEKSDEAPGTEEAGAVEGGNPHAGVKAERTENAGANSGSGLAEAASENSADGQAEATPETAGAPAGTTGIETRREELSEMKTSAAKPEHQFYARQKGKAAEPQAKPAAEEKLAGAVRGNTAEKPPDGKEAGPPAAAPIESRPASEPKIANPAKTGGKPSEVRDGSRKKSAETAESGGKTAKIAGADSKIKNPPEKTPEPAAVEAAREWGVPPRAAGPEIISRSLGIPLPARQAPSNPFPLSADAAGDAPEAQKIRTRPAYSAELNGIKIRIAA